jgi:superfamily II DNA or RNA helicase
MSQAKRERRRRKRAEKRKHRVRERTQLAQGDARRWQSFASAARADEHLRRGAIAEALRDAARAVALSPRDPAIAELHLAAAERSGDIAEQAGALEHLSRLVQPDARMLARLAYVRLQIGDTDGAREAAVRARALWPRRMKDRKRWLTLLEHVEMRSRLEDAEAAGDPAESELPLFDDESRVDETPAASEDRGAGPSPADPREAAHPLAPPAVPSESAAPPFLEIPVEIASGVDGIEILARDAFSDPEEVELALLAASIRDVESYDRLFAVERAQGLLRLSHQEETARKVLSVLLGRALLADEVGLGKTIEAGLVLSEYLLRGRIENALVLAPPSLVGQWREELQTKFAIEVRTTEDGAFRADPERFWSGRGVAVASLATARSSRHRELVTAGPWDLVIVDEAHALKNARSESYALVSRLTSRFLLLLTATPVENRLEELYNLVSLIRPGHLGGRAAFLRRLSDSRGRPSEAARVEVRALLGEVMVRNTRALSGVRLPPRFARTVLVAPDPAESELYEHLATALRALGTGGRTRLLLSVLLQEAGSSPFAVRATLEKVRSDPELPAAVAEALAPAIRCAERSIDTGKAAALVRILGGAGEPAVVFTRFRATLDFLAGALARAGIAHERIDGDVPPPLRHEAIARLRARGGVLLSTEIGSEGLNLQFCHRIVNFDLPWNPMRIEQRIGRVHRIGQDHPVEVVNFCLAGSIEERILQILDERINLFELVVGEVEMILGYLDDEREFDDLVLEAFADPQADGRERRFARIADSLASARAQYENVKRFDEGFFRNELGV